MSKFGGILKRIKQFINLDNNKYRIHNDPSLLDPYYRFPELRPNRFNIK